MNLTARVYLFYCLVSAPFCSAQIALFGELYISKYNEFHIAFETTYFAGGKIITINENKESGVVSFGPRSQWYRLEKNSYIIGTVKIYHSGRFTFPLGSATIFSPITLELFQNTGFIEVSYAEQTPKFLPIENHNLMLPSFHYWSWNTEGNILGQIRTYWWPEHTLHKLGFDAFNPFTIGLLLNQEGYWKKINTQALSNPFVERLPLSIHFGSAQSTSDLNFSQTEGVSFTRLLQERFPTKKRISQVLTPNNDGVNDKWKISGYLFSAKSKIKLYNLSGKLVFEHHGVYHNDWEGANSFSGEQLPGGSYYYHINFEGSRSSIIQGWLLIKYN